MKMLNEKCYLISAHLEKKSENKQLKIFKEYFDILR